MTLSRWRRIATGIAAGVIVLCAALVGGSFRSDSSGVSVASEIRPAVVIPIEEDPVEEDIAVDTDTVETLDEQEAEPTEVPEDAAPAPDAADGADTDAIEEADPDTTGDTDAPLTDPVQVDGTDDAEAATEDPAAQEPASEPATPPAPVPAPTQVPAAPAAPAPPLTPTNGLGTGGGVDDAECALDRLVIYAGARRGGVAGSIRTALAQAGFAAGCPAPVTVLAANCPLQFSGALGAGSGYDPTRSYVASSSNVDRETMTAIMGTIGYAGATIDILDFGFVTADRPGEQWMAVFIPPSFSGWENLANRAGLGATSQSLCSPSGRLAG